MKLSTREHDFTSQIPEQNKTAIKRRLNTICGQVEGLIRMVEENRPCPEVLIQVAAVRGAIHHVGVLFVATCVKNRLPIPDGFGSSWHGDDLTDLLIRLHEDD